MMQRHVFFVFLLLSLLFLTACQDDSVPDPIPTTAALVAVPTGVSSSISETGTEITLPPPSPTSIPPTPTPVEPLAALVNDEPIFLSEYEKELARVEKAQAELGVSEASETMNYRELVLNALVEQVLITQAAETQGIRITDEMVDEKLAELQNKAGESGNFEAWLEANQWTEDEFRDTLAAEMLTEQVVLAVTADVPTAVEQVRARYLQVNDLALAQSLLERIRNGDDFALLAEQYSLDRLTAQNGGDLGFFARGSLLVPDVETAAFALAPGEISDIISNTNEDNGQITYYLVELIERDPQRPLTAELRYALLQQSFESWLTTLWERATIVRFVDTGI